MDSYQISFFVARSNPVLLRTLRLAGGLTFGELAELVGISFGLQDCSGIFRLHDEECPDNAVLSDVLDSHAEGELFLSENGASSLLLHFTVQEKSAEPVSLPCVTEHIGFSLPRGQSDIILINSISSALLHGSSATSPDMAYTKSSLVFSEKKTENAIRKRFAPETAEKEICHAFSRPLLTILNRLRITDLKGIAQTTKLYISGTKKKAEIISIIHSHISKKVMEQLFQNLPLTEYLRFRRYAMSETQAEMMNAPDDLPTFAAYGLLSSAGDEVCFACELLEYYETWFQTDKEKEYLTSQVLQQSMFVCCQLYGVFSLEMFSSVVDRLNTVTIDREKLEQYFYQTFFQEYVFNICILPQPLKGDKNVKYDKRWLNAAPASTLWGNSYHGENSWYIPDDATLTRLLEKQALIEEEQLIPLYQLAETYCYHVHDREGAKKNVRELLHSIQSGASPETVLKTGFDLFRSWSSWKGEHLEADITEWVAANEDIVPRVTLGGYSDQSCPDWLKAAAEEQKAQRAEEQKASRKQKSAERRMAKQKER